MYKVTFYQLRSGKSPSLEFYRLTSENTRSKIMKQIINLEKFGLTRDNPSLRKLTGTKLWEVRILGNDNIRMMCVVVMRDEVLILHIFKKKSNKTPTKEINIAINRFLELDI